LVAPAWLDLQNLFKVIIIKILNKKGLKIKKIPARAWLLVKKSQIFIDSILETKPYT
jgi:hypothetical protein